MAEVVNFRRFGSVDELNRVFGNRWLYIGRANRAAGLPQSPLANPYRASVHGRGQTLPHYRRWLWAQIRAGQPAVLAALRACQEATVLVCWCRPDPCHGDVVQAAAAWLHAQEVSS